MKDEIKHISKFMSLVLRHQPGEIGLVLDENGWANVEELIEGMRRRGFKIDKNSLDNVVANNNKKRFAFNENQTMIRASQGHSIDIDLDLEPVEPPALLYHGTAEKNITMIMKEGLQKMNRQHVHLSIDTETAINVGRRHGKPVIITVNAGEMYKQGAKFYLSANGVWLTEFIALQYLSL